MYNLITIEDEIKRLKKEMEIVYMKNDPRNMEFKVTTLIMIQSSINDLEFKKQMIILEQIKKEQKKSWFEKLKDMFR